MVTGEARLLGGTTAPPRLAPAVDRAGQVGCDGGVPDDAPHPGILFTVFEPSGDQLAAPVIAALKHRLPDLPVYAWGGKKMAQAGAELVEDTCDKSAMLLPGYKLIREHMAMQRRIEAFLKQRRVLLHVPVDSPAANFPICKLARRAGCTIVHLVAPQVWAWAEHRVQKLRRLTDLVLCLLPFEETWFKDRGVPAVFIGHPLFDQELPDVREKVGGLPHGSPRLALLPGSRVGEVKANFPVMLRTFLDLQARHRGMAGVVVATNDLLADLIERQAADSSDALAIRTDMLYETLAWCDLALVTSGTVTLQVARSRRPMVVLYKVRGLHMWLLYRTLKPLLMKTKHFALPNVLAGERAVPEFAPHFGGHGKVLQKVGRYLDDSRLGSQQVARMQQVLEPFEGREASKQAAEEIGKMYTRRRKAV